MTTKTIDAKKSAAKMAKGVTGTVHLSFLLDESGSMSGNEEGVVNGVHEFLASFKKKDARVWLASFDAHPGEDRTRIHVKGEKVDKVKFAIGDYKPRGMTPLNDAVLDTIAAMDKRVKKDERAFVVILTDGMENASEASAETVRDAIKKREKAGWGFLYIGANHDVGQATASLGLSRSGGYTSVGSSGGMLGALRTASNVADLYVSASSAGDFKAKADAAWKASGGVAPEADQDE